MIDISLIGRNKASYVRVLTLCLWHLYIRFRQSLDTFNCLFIFTQIKAGFALYSSKIITRKYLFYVG